MTDKYTRRQLATYNLVIGQGVQALTAEAMVTTLPSAVDLDELLTWQEWWEDEAAAEEPVPAWVPEVANAGPPEDNTAES